jgi:hypothetical protein
VGARNEYRCIIFCRRYLFLPSLMDHAPPIGRVVEGIEQRIVKQAGQSVDRVESGT